MSEAPIAGSAERMLSRRREACKRAGRTTGDAAGTATIGGVSRSEELFQRAGLSTAGLFSFDGARCDRLVAGVLARIGVPTVH